MDSQGMFGGPFFTIEKVLGLRSFKHNLIVSNIANADTPNYKAFDLLLEQEMERVLQTNRNSDLMRTQPGHLPVREGNLEGLKPKIFAVPQLSPRVDGNTVDIDKMMAKLAENSLMYNALAQILSKKFAGLKYAIQEGKR